MRKDDQCVQAGLKRCAAAIVTAIEKIRKFRNNLEPLCDMFLLNAERNLDDLGDE